MAKDKNYEEDKEELNESLSEIHYEAITMFDDIQSSLREERLQCLTDRRFYSVPGAQWEGELSEQFYNKPKFEVNKIHLSIIRIINEYRNNRITVDFISKDGTQNDKLADVCDGLYRADEQDSNAEEAYDNAFEEAVGGGFGAWRLRAEYEDDEDEDNDHQRICIEPIYDADSSVFFDLNAKRQDKSDARYCYVLSSMTKEAFEHEYGDEEDMSSVSKQVEQRQFDWYSPDIIYIAEYYVIETVEEELYIFKSLDGKEEKYTKDELEDDKDEANEVPLIDYLASIGTKLDRKRKVKRKKCHKYILSGSKILEDCGYIAGNKIPIIPVYGKRWFVDNIERCMGHVRLAKDAQRIKNMQLSKLGEISALSSIEKPILTPEQISGHTQMWSDDNIKNFPYLLINPITDMNGNITASGPIAYTRAPNIPPAMAALLQLTEQDMKEILGNQQGGEQIVSNISGKAVEMIQQRLDMQTFIYVSNMAKAMKRSGEVWLSMAKDVMVEPGRKMKMINDNGESESTELIKPMMGENGEVVYENDLSNAKFDVAVDVGPSSSSKKAATVSALTGMMQVTSDPETMQVLGAMSMMNMEGEGVKDVQNYYRRKLIKMGVITPSSTEAQELMQEAQNTPPNAQEEYFRKAADNEDAKAKQANANTIKILADAEQSQAKTIEIYAGIDQAEREQAMAAMETLKNIFGGSMPQQNIQEQPQPIPQEEQAPIQ